MSIVPGYAGQNQSAAINVPAWIAYKYIDWEEGPWVMPPYAIFYPGPPPTLLPMGYPALSQSQSLGWIRWVSGFYG
jgi:hypothetical protein